MTETPPSRRRRRSTGENGEPPASAPGEGSGNTRAKRESSPPPKRETPRTPPLRSNSLEAKLNDFFAAMAFPFAAAGDMYCAGIIARGAPGLAHSWAELAKQNASVNRMLNRLVEGSAWGGVIFSTAAIAVPIAAHHNLLPAGLGEVFSTETPDEPQPGEGFPGGWTMPPEETFTPPTGETAQQETSADANGDMTPPIRPDAPPGTVRVSDVDRSTHVPAA